MTKGASGLGFASVFWMPSRRTITSFFSRWWGEEVNRWASSRPACAPLTRSSAPASVVHIHALYVRPRYRGEGLGRELLEQALTWGRARGCSEATLSVLVGNPARGLYEGAGFEAFELQMRRNL